MNETLAPSAARRGLLGALLPAAKKYGFLLRELIVRDFKVKYKRSALGMLWSLLYPVLMMCVMALVFRNVFRFSMPGVSYLSYLMTGLTFFSYFSEASNLAMSSVVANSALLRKVYMPKYIFPLSKCLFVGINFLLTLLPLYAVILLTGTGLCWQHLLLPFAYLCLLGFTLGMGLLLAAAAVFLRDLFYIYGIVLTIWTYLTPIMYDVEMVGSRTLVALMGLNPLYQYISFARTIVLFHATPTARQFLVCALSALLALGIGAAFFRRGQDRFIYYL